MNTITSSWTRRIAAAAVFAGASTLIALGAPAASHADTNPAAGCETIHWGFLGSDRRQICDGPQQPDGTWQRTRTIFTPSYFKPLSCNSTPDWPFSQFLPAPGPSPDPGPSPGPDPMPDPDGSSDDGSISDAGFSSSSSGTAAASFASFSVPSSSLRCTGGYQVPQNTQSQDSYVVAPNTVPAGEPGWLPPGTNNIL